MKNHPKATRTLWHCQSGPVLYKREALRLLWFPTLFNAQWVLQRDKYLLFLTVSFEVVINQFLLLNMSVYLFTKCENQQWVHEALKGFN